MQERDVLNVSEEEELDNGTMDKRRSEELNAFLDSGAMEGAHRARNFPDGLSTCMDASPSPNELVLCCFFFVVVPFTYVL